MPHAQKILWSTLFLLFAGIQDILAQQHPYPLVDMHVYSAHKPFTSKEVKPYNIWEDIEHDCAEGLSEELSDAFKERSKQSQSNLSKMIRGNVALSQQVIAPTEAQLYKNPIFGSANGVDYFACTMGERYKNGYFASSYIPYFERVVEQIRFLQKESEYKFYLNSRPFISKVIYNAEDVETVMDNPARLGLLLSIKGGHSLSKFYTSPENRHYLEGKQFEQEVLLNVARLKGLRPLKEDTEEYLNVPIFSISFSNYFQDGICGKARLLSEQEENVLGEQETLNQGFTAVGKKVTRSLCDNKEGRRVLIDVSGMSVESRRWYYNYLRDQRYAKDSIPILASHVGISGISWSADDYTDDRNRLSGQNQYFNNRHANLSREDILQMREAGGLIGLVLDKRYLLGANFQERYDKTIPGSADRRDVAIEALVANICQVIFVIQDIKAWDIISISSKFDGSTHPFDAYKNASDLNKLADDLMAFFEAPRSIPGVFTAKQIERFMYNYDAPTLVKKIMYENATRFIKTELQNLHKAEEQEAKKVD